MLFGRAGEVYNIGGDNERSNLDIARLILKYFGRDESWFEFVPDRPGHDRRYSIDASKIKRELGWKPTYTIEKTLPETIQWYITHRDWIEKIRKKTGIFNPHIDLWKGLMSH